MTGSEEAKKKPRRGLKTRKSNTDRKNKFKSDRFSSVANILTKSFPGLNIEAHLREYKIKKLWQACVGINLAKNSTPVNLVKNTLNCSVSSSAWMNELTYRKAAIIKKMNSLLKEEAITTIIFRIGAIDRVTPATTPEPKAANHISKEDADFIEMTTGQIRDETIREAIKKAMRAAVSE